MVQETCWWVEKVLDWQCNVCWLHFTRQTVCYRKSKWANQQPERRALTCDWLSSVTWQLTTNQGNGPCKICLSSLKMVNSLRYSVWVLFPSASLISIQQHGSTATKKGIRRNFIQFLLNYFTGPQWRISVCPLEYFTKADLIYKSSWVL